MDSVVVKLALACALSPWLAVQFASASDGGKSLRQMVAEDVAKPVRPGGVDGQPFWNANSVWFLYPPSFDFPEVKGVDGYRFRVFDAKGKVHDFEAKNPKESLSRIWAELPTGKTDVWCEGYVGWVAQVKHRSFRSFYKMAPYDPDAYPKPPRTYADATKLGYAYVLNLPELRKFVATGKPDPDYKLNCYPSKIHSSVIRAMVRCAKRGDAQREPAIKLAKVAGEYLLSIAIGEGQPLAGFTPTYEGTNFTARAYAGQNMLDYPSSVGLAFLELHQLLGEEKYLKASERIANTYLRLQGEDGTWYLKLWEKDGKPVNANRLHPLSVINFMDAMFKTTGKKEYRECADRAFGFIEKGPLTDWNWEGQFEDVEPMDKYINLTFHPACSTAIRIVRRWPKDEKRIAQARELLRYAEDQFVCWRRPYAEQKVNLVGGGWDQWLVEPGVVEQYYYREIIDGALSKMIRTYLALYRATGNPLDLAKAKTLGGALVRAQQPSGRIPTLLNTWAAKGNAQHLDWLNCMIGSFMALDELSEIE